MARCWVGSSVVGLGWAVGQLPQRLSILVPSNSPQLHNHRPYTRRRPLPRTAGQVRRDSRAQGGAGAAHQSAEGAPKGTLVVQGGYCQTFVDLRRLLVSLDHVWALQIKFYTPRHKVPPSPAFANARYPSMSTTHASKFTPQPPSTIHRSKWTLGSATSRRTRWRIWRPAARASGRRAQSYRHELARAGQRLANEAQTRRQNQPRGVRAAAESGDRGGGGHVAQEASRKVANERGMRRGRYRSKSVGSKIGARRHRRAAARATRTRTLYSAIRPRPGSTITADQFFSGLRH